MRRLSVVSLLFAACHKEPPAKPDPVAGIDLPVVAAAAPIDVQRPLLVAMTGIRFEGQTIVPLQDGVVDPSEKEGGLRGMKLPRLTNFLAQVRKLPNAPDPLAIAFDKHTTYRLMMEVLFSAKQQETGWKRFDILAKANDKLVAIPVTLPDKRPSSTMDAKLVRDKLETAYLPSVTKCYKELLAKQPDARGKLALAFDVKPDGRLMNKKVTGMDEALDGCVQSAMYDWTFDGDASYAITLTLDPANGGSVHREADEPVLAATTDTEARLVVTVTDKEIRLWSFSGLEGTLQEPKATLDPKALDRLAKALEEIANRRKTEPTIVIMADGQTSMQRVAEIMATARVYFPDLQFASGFE